MCRDGSSRRGWKNGFDDADEGEDSDDEGKPAAGDDRCGE